MHLHYKHIGHSCKMLNIIALQTYIVAYIYIFVWPCQTTSDCTVTYIRINAYVAVVRLKYITSHRVD